MSAFGPWTKDGVAYYRRNAKGQTGARVSARDHEVGPNAWRFGWFALVADGRSRHGQAKSVEAGREAADAALAELEGA